MAKRKISQELHGRIVRMLADGYTVARVIGYLKQVHGVTYSISRIYKIRETHVQEWRHARAYDPEYVRYVIETAREHKPSSHKGLQRLLAPDRLGRIPHHNQLKEMLVSAGITLKGRAPKGAYFGKNYGHAKHVRAFVGRLYAEGWPTSHIQSELLRVHNVAPHHQTLRNWARRYGVKPHGRTYRVMPTVTESEPVPFLTRDWEAAEARSIRAAGAARWWESDEAGRPIRRRRAA